MVSLKKRCYFRSLNQRFEGSIIETSVKTLKITASVFALSNYAAQDFKSSLRQTSYLVQPNKAP